MFSAPFSSIWRDLWRPLWGDFDPRQLFLAGEQGAWYDPSDLTTLFQDGAGTTPVTAVEQPVRLMRDKSGRNNHALAPSDAARPVLRSRVNLLTATENFADAIWGSTAGATWTALSGDPFGAYVLKEDSSTGLHRQVSSNSQATFVSGVGYTATIEAKLIAGTRRVRLSSGSTATINYSADFDLATGTVISGPGVITALADGWYRLSTAATASASAGSQSHIISLISGTSNSYAGDNVSAIAFRKPDLRVTNDGVNLPPYQRVTTSTDYDTAGFPLYLAFDGTDDSMSTSAIDFSAGDKMTVFAGVRKLSDAADGAIIELSASVTLNNGVFGLFAPSNATVSRARFVSKGTLVSIVDAPVTLEAPITFVSCGKTDISGDDVSFRINGAQVAVSATDQGSGNYGNHSLFIGSRNNASVRFQGRVYSLIVRGAASNAAQIAAAETWVNGKTRAY